LFGYGDNRRGSGTARRLNSDPFRKIRRLRGSKNFISEKEKLVRNAFLDLQPVKRLDYRSDV